MVKYFRQIYSPVMEHTWLIGSGGQLYHDFTYGLATISRLLKIIGLFCKRALWKRRYSAKETYNFKEPTNRSHSIVYNDYIYSMIKSSQNWLTPIGVSQLYNNFTQWICGSQLYNDFIR